MTPDHEAALAKCKAWPHKSNTATCYLDAMARLVKAEKERDAYKRAKQENDERFMLERDEARTQLDKATELIEKLLLHYNEEYWGPSPDETEKAARAFLAAERK